MNESFISLRMLVEAAAALKRIDDLPPGAGLSADDRYAVASANAGLQVYVNHALAQASPVRVVDVLSTEPEVA